MCWSCLTRQFLSGYLLSVGALILEEMAFRRYTKLSDLVKMLLFSALKFVGYHQLGVLWRVQGIFNICKTTIHGDHDPAELER